MITFDHIIEKKIINIQRLDSEADYQFYTPYAIIYTLDNQSEKLIISATNDGSSVDIRMTSDGQIEEDYELEFCEHILNDLKKDDELSGFIGDKLQSIKIAGFNLPEITEPDVVIQQGRNAGFELTTGRHKLLFQNNYCGWRDINDDMVKLPNQDKWQWK
ncbi:MAG: hypothetical protein JJU46_14675 [Balneolaceae bacterium]|nr:hypothetical protein [Balneolaceae bacterium]MCH8535957.1 hypothetical protein [Flavobacteriaceae bacterium]